MQRREYHRMVAAAMERVYAGRIEAVAESYAQHLQSGGRQADAVAAILRAGTDHRDQQFFERALDCFLRGIAWHDAAPRNQKVEGVEAELHVSAGEVAALLGLPGAERMFSVALDIASDAGPRGCEARALLGLGRLYAGRGKFAVARANVEDAVRISRRVGDLGLRVQCLEALGEIVHDEGDAEEARRIYAEGLEVAGSRGDLAARMVLGLANHALRKGDNPAALALLRQALPHAERASDRVLVGRIVNNIGIALLDEGRPEEALAEFRRSLELRRGLGYRRGEVINLHNIGDTYFRMGDHPRAWAAFEQSRDLARDSGWDRGAVLNEVYLDYLRGLRGEATAEALAALAGQADRLGEPEAAFTARWFAAALVGDEVAKGRVAAEAAGAGFGSLARQLGGSAG